MFETFVGEPATSFLQDSPLKVICLLRGNCCHELCHLRKMIEYLQFFSVSPAHSFSLPMIGGFPFPQSAHVVVYLFSLFVAPFPLQPSEACLFGRFYLEAPCSLSSFMGLNMPCFQVKWLHGGKAN